MTTHTRGFGLAAVLLAAGCAVKAAEPAAEAAAILQTAGVQGGLIVHLGCGDGRLTVGLRANDRFLVHGLDADPARVAKARALVHGRGLGGKVSVSRWSGERLPFVDNLIRLLVVSDPGGVPAKEMLRVLAPDGVLCVRQDGAWERQVKPRPEAMDAWTHFLRDPSNNAVSRDRLVGPPRRMQWLAEPLWCRYHHTLASISSVVCTSQRVFSIVDEATAGWMEVPGRWRLVARDAFNGVLLWKRPIDSWAWHRRGFRSGPVQLPRTLVAGGGCVYLPLGLDRPVSALDAATGETVHGFK
ncbi:MAG: class I SAM-dependent methyltransferase, partial [Planctomycetota bacterium]